jgi:hypothetical protein
MSAIDDDRDKSAGENRTLTWWSDAILTSVSAISSGLPEAVEDDSRAGRRECARDTQADPARRSSDERDLALKQRAIGGIGASIRVFTG